MNSTEYENASEFYKWCNLQEVAKLSFLIILQWTCLRIISIWCPPSSLWEYSVCTCGSFWWLDLPSWRHVILTILRIWFDFITCFKSLPARFASCVRINSVSPWIIFGNVKSLSGSAISQNWRLKLATGCSWCCDYLSLSKRFSLCCARSRTKRRSFTFSTTLAQLLWLGFLLFQKLVRQSILWVSNKSLIGWLILELMACYIAIINSFVHIIMYSYYFTSSFSDVKLQSIIKRIKPLITIIQLVQFGIIIGHCIVAILPDCNCSYFFHLQIVNFVVLTVLFGNFFVQSYLKKEKTEKNNYQLTQTWNVSIISVFNILWLINNKMT